MMGLVCRAGVEGIQACVFGDSGLAVDLTFTLACCSISESEALQWDCGDWRLFAHDIGTFDHFLICRK